MPRSEHTVVISLLGQVLDAGKDEGRWQRWRPTVAMCQHEELLVSRLELLRPPGDAALAQRLARDIAQVSPETEVRFHDADFDDPWDLGEVYGVLSGFARDYPWREDREDYLVNITTGTHVAQICLFLLVETRHLPGRLLQVSPPKRKNSGQPGSYHVIDLDLARYDAIATRFAVESREGVSFLKSGIETEDPGFNRQVELIEQVAIASPEPILLMGPTGAGKSQLARRIFELKKQRHHLGGAMVEVNCATLRGDTAHSTLFGHTRGAFTGAAKDRPGLLLSADHGLLFLDEIGELGLDEQAMLLRALEEKRFLPLGADREQESDFQLIAGTNRDLRVAVREGRFRDDLFARINLWTFTLPGLRDRIADIPPNLQYELDKFAQKTGRRVTFNKEARDLFLAFARSGEATWDGNFRDLNAAVTRMATLAPKGRVTSSVVEDEIERLRQLWRAPATGTAAVDLGDYFAADRLDEIDPFDAVQLAEVIRVCRESKSLSDAGRLLFAASRRKKTNPNDADRLRKYLARFDLTFKDL